MAYPQWMGQADKILNQGRLIYGGDGTNARPVKTLTDGRLVISQREPFEFRPGQSALAGGAVAAGSRTSSGTITTGGSADVTYWGGWVQYAPLRSGLIDGLASGGIVEGQFTIGLKASTGTNSGKLSAQIANTANTSAPTTVLALTGTIACTTAEVFQTYDLNYLQCDTVFNAVPFSIRIGVQTNIAASSNVARIMESTDIRGEFEPGT